LNGKYENKKADKHTTVAPAINSSLNFDSPSKRILATKQERTTDIEVAKPFRTLSAYLNTTATTYKPYNDYK
jgi:hypothetical protein